MDEKGYIVTEEIWEEVEDEAPPATTAPPAAKKPVLAGRRACACARMRACIQMSLCVCVCMHACASALFVCLHAFLGVHAGPDGCPVYTYKILSIHGI